MPESSSHSYPHGGPAAGRNGAVAACTGATRPSRHASAGTVVWPLTVLLLLGAAACGDDGSPADPGNGPTANQAPVARISADADEGPAPLAVLFDGSESFDPDGEIVEYRWDFGDGASAMGPVVEHVYQAPGYFFPRLTVTDDRGATGTVVDSARIVTAGPGEGGGVIEGYVWHDRSGGGTRAPGDPGIAGSVVFLDLDESGIRGEGEPYTVTDREGHFSFPGVETDRGYRVTQELGVGWTNTFAGRVEVPSPDFPGGINRIIGGTPVQDDRFPFMVALLRADIASNASAFTCGGSFIASRWILTAAHCVATGDLSSIRPPEAFEVLVGTRDLTSGGERIPVERIRVFPAFGVGSFAADDVALLELGREFMIPRAILQIPERPHQSAPGLQATAIGWGRTSLTGSISQVLREVNLPLISNGECRQMLDEEVVDSTLCAGAFGTSESTCSGDSGGPLMTPSGDGWVQVGLTSFGRNCQPPIAFARISEFRDWIRSQVPVEPSMAVDVDWSGGTSVRVEFGNFR